MKLVPLALLLTFSTGAVAQTPAFTDPANLRGERVTPSNCRELPIDQGTLGLQQLLRRLDTRASILNIVAHPDDEDGGMLTYYSRGLGARVADLALTRGEGGQNAVTGDFEDALGLLRTQELLSNDRYVGVNQMFGTEVDFGFSKTKEEAFAKWTHQRVLYDAVRAIRIFRPLVITATFIGGVTDGHGQHQVSGEIAQEAFKAAADPTVFPDMIREGILPWQALRVYARVPRGAITDKGLFDYATNQYTPARFTNYVTGAVTTTIPSVDVVVDEGTKDPLLTDSSANSADLLNPSADHHTELSYVQFARLGLGLQRSQIGPGVRNAPSGTFDVGYHLYGSALCNAPSSAASPSISPRNCHPERSEGPASSTAGTLPASHSSQNADPNFFTGIDTSILSIQDLAPDAFPTDMLSSIARGIQAATDQFDPAHPEKIAPALAASLKTMDELIPEVEKDRGDPIQKANALHELRIKRVQLNNALTLALGLHLVAAAPAQDILTDSTASATIDLIETSGLPVSYTKLSSKNSLGQGIETSSTSSTLSSTNPVTALCGLSPDLTATATRPYFSRPNIELPFYDLSNPELRNAPATPPALSCYVQVTYNGIPLTLGAIAVHDSQPVSLVPPFSIASSPSATVFPFDQTKVDLTATLRTTSRITANINVESPHNWSIQARAASAPSTATDHPIEFFAHPTQTPVGPQIFHVTATTPDRHVYTEGFRAVGYPGLIATNYYTPATTRVVPVDLKLPEHHRIAYLPGTGDAVPQALASIGLAPTILTVAELTPANLALYDSVILGVRTYYAHHDLHGAPTRALLDYARNGGNLLVQYQTGEFTAADAPYPLALGDAEKVVDETDPVTLLSPQTLTPLTCTKPFCLLTTPNQITSADFNNWIEERGHGFLATWDSHYTALTETHDPGGPETAPQLPQRGGLITTSVGKGRWTYCAFALYRQLPEAVPGAFRIFVNLITP
jgi:LmbE family N-acetylglucosaminyl deacetylase